jgi:hypothetical protein
MHLVSTSSDVTITVDPHSCLQRVGTHENAHITGGTGIFANASGTFTGSVSILGRLPRSSDGSCDAGKPALHEVDNTEFSGTLSF